VVLLNVDIFNGLWTLCWIFF